MYEFYNVCLVFAGLVEKAVVGLKDGKKKCDMTRMGQFCSYGTECANMTAFAG